MSYPEDLKPLTNIDGICRICLKQESNMLSLLSNIKKIDKLEDDVCTLNEALAKLISVPVLDVDRYPSLICDQCAALLYSAYKFKVLLDYSQRILQDYFDKAKNEVCENDIVDYEPDFSAESPINNDVEFDGTRSTSKTQIRKRASNEQKQNKRRGRKTKARVKYDESESETEDKPVLHPCPICTKEFPALELREHAYTHKALKKYLTIPETEKVSSNTRFYLKTWQLPERVSLHNRKEKIHKCVNCGLECTATQLRIHLQTHRNQAEYRCDQCERVFKKLNHLNTHRVKHLKEFPYKCEKCGKGFVIKMNYDCHVLTHDTNQELPHECRLCLKRFSNPEHLNRHMVIHTENISYSVKYKVCKCHHCLKTFKDRYDLKTHDCVPVEQAVNTRFPCKICNKVFKNSSGLYNHNRNIHKLKGAKVLCSVCGNHVSNIYNHMMRHSGEKPFQCNQCGKRFVGKPQLRQHLLVHSGLKPFVCSVCAKAFNNLYNLQVHERIHKGDRCHICTICNKGFLEKSYLKKHMNVHAKL